jgi:hypothetical protein
MKQLLAVQCSKAIIFMVTFSKHWNAVNIAVCEIKKNTSSQNPKTFGILGFDGCHTEIFVPNTNHLP